VSTELPGRSQISVSYRDQNYSVNNREGALGPGEGTGTPSSMLLINGPAYRSEPLMENDMLYWALVFLIISIVAAVLGFGGIAATASSIAQILFFIFLVIFLITLVMGLAGRRRPPI
jgi:uncharacterized membrane protein YtjA (UPF0391 family)